MLKYSSVTVATVERIAGTVRDLGWDVPEDLANAVTAARRVPNIDPVGKARSALFNAKTDAEYADASRALANAYAVQEAAQSPGFLNDLDVYRELALTAALDNHVDDLFDRVIEDYNSLAPSFSDAVRRLPILDPDLKPINLDPDALTALSEAKRQAPRMTALVGLYGSLLDYGHADGLSLDIENEWSGYDLATKIGEFPTWANVQHAGLLLRRWSWHDDSTFGAYRELAPHALVVIAGGRLNMVRPADADVRQQRLLRAAFPATIDDGDES